MTIISRTQPAARMDRHRHAQPYAAVILSGGYVEAGDAGRFRVEAGDVLLHDRFEAHADRFGRHVTDLIDIPLESRPAFPKGRIDDVESLVRLAERDIGAAARLLAEETSPCTLRERDWPDELAIELTEGTVSSLSEWADAKALRPASVSRGFRLAYGVTPQRFQLERKARIAALHICESAAPLSVIAYQAGFADQAHMSRAVRAITGVNPKALRRGDAQCVQERRALFD